MPQTPGPLLIAEDDPDDLFLLQRALKRAHILLRQQAVQSGEEAINYIAGRDPFSDRDKFPVPSALLLDLKMPLISGFEVLEWIRAHSETPPIDVFVLTGSSIERDRERALALGAKAYLIKPATPETLRDLLAPNS